MTSTDGVNYTFKKEGVTLSKGTIEYKIVEDHSWNVSYGQNGGNATYKLDEDGVYDVVVSFNASTKVPSMEATKKGSATVEHTWSIIGTVFGTNWNQDFPMVKGDDGKYRYSVTDYAIGEGDYEFKARADGAWELSYPSTNQHLKITEDGIYDITFTLDVDAGTVEVVATKKSDAEVEKTYTVAGSPGELFDGGAWDPANTANDMTAVGDGTYILTKENVTLSAGEIQFKIVTNHAWNVGEYGQGGKGGGDIIYEVAEAGLYNVTFTFNPEEEDVTPQITVTPVTYDFTKHTYRVCGNSDLFGGTWGQTQGDATLNPMTLTDGKFVWTKTGYVVATAHSEDYRVMVDNDYTTASPFNIDGIQNNKAFTFDAAGTYDVTVTFDPEALTVSAVATAVETPQPEAVYTIVGVKDVINGDVVWDPTATANDMTESATAAGVYELVVEGANLTAGTEYEYKMAANHAWSQPGEVPAQGNQILTVDENGEYTITYTYDGTTLSYSVVKTGSDEPVEVDGQELVSGDHKVVIKGVHYLNLAENNYVLTITSEETMTGLGGSFWSTSNGNKDVSENINISADGKTITLTTTSTTDPELYTPLYVKMPGEVNFGIVTIEWEEVGEVAYTVTLLNEEGWETVKAYAWNDAGVVTATWPGDEMTKVDGSDNLWTITLDAEPTMIVFNNGTDQTDDLEFVNGKQYTNKKAATESYTVKFVNVAGWGDVYVYGWNGGTNSGWTATKATQTSTVNVFGVDAGVYECTIALSVEPKNLIFHNNEGDQTDDLQWVEGATYAYDSNVKGYFLFTDDDDQFKPAENIAVTGKASYARKFNVENKVSTVVLPFAIGADVAAAAGKFYRITEIADGYVRGSEETPAPYVPYIFEPATEYPFTLIGVGQLPAVQDNKVNISAGTFEFVTETANLVADDNYDYYGFSGGEFVKVAYATANPFRAYLKVSKAAGAPATLKWIGDETTAISSLKADIKNGKAEVYDLQGRRVLNPVRGLYIVNGKKAVVK